MAIKESILPEFEQEMETTRLVLERVPDAGAQWKPHPKSRSLGELSRHLADIPRFVPWIVTSDSFDAAPPGGQAYRFPCLESTAQLVSNFSANVGTAPAAIAAVPGDPDFYLLNHMIHHRGQLTVYLRLQDVPLPSVYGPTADQA